MKNQLTKYLQATPRRGFLSALIGIALVTAAGSGAFAGNDGKGKGNCNRGHGNGGHGNCNVTLANLNIEPPQSHPYGHSYAEWAERYWKWSQAFPTTANPGNGTAPQESAQTGPVWFLAGAPFNPDPTASTARQITVPEDTAIFAPALTFFNNNAALPVNTTFTEAELLQQANDIWDGAAIRTECYIDGVAVKGLEDPLDSPYFLQTGLFLVTVASHDNQFAGDGVPDGGSIDEVAVGSFLMIKPLKVGLHTIRLVGAIEPAPGFVLTKDITFTVTVKRKAPGKNDCGNGKDDRGHGGGR